MILVKISKFAELLQSECVFKIIDYGLVSRDLGAVSNKNCFNKYLTSYCFLRRTVKNDI